MLINSNTPFKIEQGCPAPLQFILQRKIRFGECDPTGVVWHGVYPVFFEEAREALNAACGLTYEKCRNAAVLMPVKTMFFDYRKPLVYEHIYAVRSILHWTEAARINMEYRIHEINEDNPAEDGELCTSGFSVQLMVDFKAQLLLEYPPCYNNFLNSWAAGDFSSLQILTY